MPAAHILMVAGAAYSLLCDGTRLTYFADFEPRSERVSVEYRVDFDAGRFCIEPCETSAPIHKVDGGVITFAKSEQRDEAQISSALLTVHQSTGAWLEHIEVVRPEELKVVTAGKCALGPAKPVPIPPSR